MFRRVALVLSLSLLTVGLPSAVSSAAGATAAPKRFAYDALGRLVAATDPAGSTARYRYDANGNITSVTTAPSSQLAVDSFTPRSGGPGTKVTVYGTGFSATAAGNTVTFNGTPATVAAVTPGALTVTVPTGAATGKITVTAGTSSASSTDSFRVQVTPTPKITSVSPAVVAPGATVTVRGSGFAPTAADDDLVLNKTRAHVLSATSTTITATVPLAASSGPVTVSTPGGMTTSGTDLFVVPQGSAATDLGTTTSIAAGQTKTVSASGGATQALLTFTAMAGQHLSVTLANPTANATLEVLDPRNRALLNTVSVSTGNTGSTDEHPTEGGRHSILISFSGTGSAQVSLASVQDVSLTARTDGTEVAATTTSLNQDAVVAFPGRQGHRISLSFDAGNIANVTLSASAPDTATVLPATRYGSSEFIEPLAPAPVTGTYRLRVHPSQPGTVKLRIWDVPPDVSGKVTVGGPAVPVTIAAPGQNGSVTFPGSAGEKVALTVTGASMTGSVYYEVDDPSGNKVWNSSFFAGGSDTSGGVLPAAGTYTIKLDPYSQATGGMTVQVAVAAAGAALAATPNTPAARVPAVPRHQPRPAPTAQHRDVVPASTRAWHPRATDAWTPTGRNRTNFRAGPSTSPWQTLPALQAPARVTALAGRVLTLDGLPLARATLTIDDQTARTDSTGRFLLTRLGLGDKTLTIDATTANRPGHEYGRYETRVALTAGRTTVLPYTIWMTRLDTAHQVTLASPLPRDTTLTNPSVPGLEVRLPKGTVIKDDDGRVVRHLGITPIPVDRPPFPLPTLGVSVPVYFTVQPGSTYAWPKGAQIVYPNWGHLAPGSQVDFWNYDADHRGWYVYGHGRVTKDGRQAAPAASTRVWEFTGAMFNENGQTPPDDAPPPGSCDSGGDPVSCATGLLVNSATDLTAPDILPLDLTRTYRPRDTDIRPFGRGVGSTYTIFLYSQNQYQEVDLILPDGGRVHYVRTSPGTGYTDAVFQSTATPTNFYQSTISWNGWGWDVTLRDGTVYLFGANGPLQSIRDRYGNQIDLTYTNNYHWGTGLGPIAQVTSPDGRWIKFTYGGCSATCVSAAEDNTGRHVSYTYDSAGQLATVTDARGGVTTYAYDSSGRMASVKDARGTVRVTFGYDSADRVTTETMADGGVWHFAYTLDPAGHIAHTDITDPRGAVRRLQFDIAGYVTAETRALGTPQQQTTTYTLDPVTHRTTAVVDPLARRATYSYDQSGNVTRLTLLAGTAGARTYTATYDPSYAGTTSVTDPLGHTYTAKYDGQGRLTGVTDPTGHTTTYTENSQGQVVKVTSPNAHATVYGYSLQDLTTVTTPTGDVSSTYVGAGGRPLQMTDPSHNLWTYSYDANANPTKQVDPRGGGTTLGYDADNNLTSYTDPLNHRTSWAYTPLNQVSKQTDPLSRSRSYTYDTGQNLTSATDASGQTTSYIYDALGRLAKVRYGATSARPTPTSTNALTWDLGNRLTKAADSANGTITRTWDNFDELTSEATSTGTLGYTYDAAGNRATMTEPGGPTVSYNYNAANRPTSLTQGSSAVTIGYDADGNATTTTLPGGVTKAATFDSDDRTSALTWTHGSTTIGTDTYTYDPRGDRTTAGGTLSALGASLAISSATYDAANELVSLNGTTNTYDKNGNLTSDGTHTYTWNARQQLTSTTGPGAQSYGYDAFGRRSTRTVGATTTSYTYDGFDAVQERSASTVTATYLDGLGLDQHYARTDPSGTFTYLADTLNTTLALTNSSGAISTSYSYGPYGATARAGAASSNPYQFTGRENEGNGLFYLRARYLHIGTGRFISPDPLGIQGDGPSTYTYVADSPATRTDPTGLCACGGGEGAGGGGDDDLGTLTKWVFVTSPMAWLEHQGFILGGTVAGSAATIPIDFAIDMTNGLRGKGQDRTAITIQLWEQAWNAMRQVNHELQWWPGEKGSGERECGRE